MIRENPAVCEVHGPYFSRHLGSIGVARPVWTSCGKCEEERLARDAETRRKQQAELAVLENALVLVNADYEEL